MPVRRHDLRTADRERLCADVVATLRGGGLAALPTESAYGVAARPDDLAAVAALREVTRRPADQPFVWHVADRTTAEALWSATPPQVARLLDRYWPGPLAVILPGRDGQPVGVRVPANGFTRAVLAGFGAPLWLAAVTGADGQPLREAAAVAERLGNHSAIVVDDGPSPLGTPTTVVRRTGKRLEVLREGILTAAEALHTAARRIVFVCTGNTCRSPLAEALARDLCARALDVPADDVLACGFDFASAGTGTLDGMPASDGSLAAGAEIGLDLTAHQSRMVDRATIERADRVYCLAASHARAVLAKMPSAKDKVELLRPDGRDIADPYGGDLGDYRATRDQIAAAIRARLDDWLAG